MYILIVYDFLSEKKVLITLMVILCKNVCKNVTLRGHVPFYVQNILQLPLTLIAHLK